MIFERKGNIFESDCDVICHQVNCQGAMGAGIAKEIRTRFPEAYKKFRETYKENGNKLGNIDVVDVCDGNRFVVNMYSQDNYLPRGIQHTDYAAFKACLLKIKEAFYDRRHEITIGFPYRIGCGLGGGNWKVIRHLIEEVFNDSPLPSSVELLLADNDKHNEDFDVVLDEVAAKWDSYTTVQQRALATAAAGENATNYEWSIDIWKL